MAHPGKGCSGLALATGQSTRLHRFDKRVIGMLFNPPNKEDFFIKMNPISSFVRLEILEDSFFNLFSSSVSILSLESSTSLFIASCRNY
jgi:hypothetical protein